MTEAVTTDELTPIHRKVLKDIATELRNHPDHWTQGAFGKDATGKSLDSWDKAAVCWCLAGLINKYQRAFYSETSFAPLRHRLTEIVGDNMVAWNDYACRTVQDVIEVCERAAA